MSSRKPSFAPQVDVVACNRTMLLHNVVQCDALYSALERAKVFPEDMIKDIKSCETPMKMNEKMLNLLEMRGVNYNNTFIDALQISGHNMIADSLRDEVLVGSQSKVSWTDMNQKLNGLDKTITKQYREKIVEMINSKISENVAREIWRRKDVDKEKVVETKQLQLEDNWNFQEKLKQKDCEIVQLKGGLDTANEEAHSSDLNSKHYHDMVDQLKKSHKEDMNRQIKYNTANEKSLQRLTERYNDSQCTLAHLTDTLKERVRHHRALSEQTGGVSMGVTGEQEPGQHEEEEEQRMRLGVVNQATPRDEADQMAELAGSSRHEHRTLEETLALIERLHKEGQLQDCVLEERRAIAELLTSKSEDNLAENLQFYIQNTNSKIVNLETMVTQIQEKLNGIENEQPSSDSVITELEKRLDLQTSQCEELKCVISALEARIAAMTADSMTLAKKRAKGRVLQTSVTPPTRRVVEVQPFNAGRALQRSSPQHNVPAPRRGYISPNRVNVDHSVTSKYPGQGHQSPRISPAEPRKRLPPKTAASLGQYTMFPVIQAGSRHAKSRHATRGFNRNSMVQLGDSSSTRTPGRWGQNLQR